MKKNNETIEPTPTAPKKRPGRKPKYLKADEPEEPKNNMVVKIEYKPHILEI